MRRPDKRNSNTPTPVAARNASGQAGRKASLARKASKARSGSLARKPSQARKASKTNTTTNNNILEFLGNTSNNAVPTDVRRGPHSDSTSSDENYGPPGFRIQGDYITPPPLQGDYRTPPPSQGDLRTPPQSHGDYRPAPPSQGDYRLPPPSQGESRPAPPPQGDYRTPPPSQGNHRTQPPSPSQADYRASPSSHSDFRTVPLTHGGFRTPPPSPSRHPHVMATGSPGRLQYRMPDSPSAPVSTKPRHRSSGLRFFKDFMSFDSSKSKKRTVETPTGERVTYQSLPTNDPAERCESDTGEEF